MIRTWAERFESLFFLPTDNQQLEYYTSKTSPQPVPKTIPKSSSKSIPKSSSKSIPIIWIICKISDIWKRELYTSWHYNIKQQELLNQQLKQHKPTTFRSNQLPRAARITIHGVNKYINPPKKKNSSRKAAISFIPRANRNHPLGVSYFTKFALFQ